MPKIESYPRRVVPDWLYMAHYEDEDVLIEQEKVTWNSGKFWGTWVDGIWKDGEFMHGTWKKGNFKGGTFKNGLWKSGTMEECKVENGLFETVSEIKDVEIENGIFEEIKLLKSSDVSNAQLKCVDKADGCSFVDVVWENGKALESTFKDCEWFNGNLESSYFASGIWHNGHVLDSDFKSVNWYNGTWEGFKFEYGVWKDGLYISKNESQFFSSVWKNGTFDAPNSTMVNSIWENGECKDCKEDDGFQDVHWKNGVWNTPEKKTFKSGIWENGTWENGTFGPSGGKKNKDWVMENEYIMSTSSELESLARKKKIPSYAIWENGLFKKGTFRNAIWYYGQVQESEDQKTHANFTNTLWIDGKVYRANMEDIGWVDGVFGLTSADMKDSFWLRGVAMGGATLKNTDFYGGKMDDGSKFDGGIFHDGQFSQKAIWLSGDFRGTAFHKGILVSAPNDPYNID